MTLRSIWRSRWLFRCIKLVFVVSTVGLIVTQLSLKRLKSENHGKEFNRKHQIQIQPQIHSYTIEHIQKQIPFEKVPHRNDLNISISDEKSFLYHSRVSAHDVSKSIEYNNAHAEMLNLDKFGPVLEDDFVIVIQVHNRSIYLNMLVSSFEKAKYIEKAVLVFSHDFVSDEINKIVRSIKFCRVIQIFYPHSIQMFPNQFPGQDSNDCSPKITKEEARKSGCNNWETPDKYNHYRVAKFTQIKHHWWWKLNYVSESMDHLKDFQGYYLLLEEDHFVSPDFIHVFKFMIAHKKSLCPECEMLSLGVYLKSYTGYKANIGRLAIFPWFSSKHNMGMAFTRSTFNRIKNCSQLFCTFDDYNWDWSLMRVNTQCIKPRLTVLFTKAPRVFHIGEIGIHHNKFAVDKSVNEVNKVLMAVKDDLFPDNLTIGERSRRSLRPPKENGGWADPRDHKLCLKNAGFIISNFTI